MIQVSATDADDPTYGNSARVVYSILEGQPYFSVDAKTGEIEKYYGVYFQVQTKMSVVWVVCCVLGFYFYFFAS